jgi:hypothetical protein
MPLTPTANRDSHFVSIGITHLRFRAGSLLAPSGATLRVLHSRELSRSTRLDFGLRKFRPSLRMTVGLSRSNCIVTARMTLGLDDPNKSLLLRMISLK